MRRLVIVFVILAGCAICASAATQGPLTTVQAIQQISSAEADRRLPVAFEATVSFYRDYERLLFVQEEKRGIFVIAPKGLALLPGDRVRIEGSTQASYRTVILPAKISVLRHGSPPAPVPAGFDDLVSGRVDSLRVKLRGVIRSAVDGTASGRRKILLHLVVDGSPMDASVNLSEAEADVLANYRNQRLLLESVLDSELEITGTAAGEFDGKSQIKGVILQVPSVHEIRILKRSARNEWQLPVTEMDQILSQYHVKDTSRRVKVSGTVTYFDPGSSLILQNGSKSIWINTRSRRNIRVGDLADVTGFPQVHNGFLALTDSDVLDREVYAPVQPLLLNWKELATSRHIFDLVSMEGEVVMQAREATQDEYVLTADGHLFSAIFSHPYEAPNHPLPPIRLIPIGSKVRVTGICGQEHSNSYVGEVPFQLLIRGPDDLLLLQLPSIINLQNLRILVRVLVVIVLLIGIWGWSAEKKLRRQTAALAARVEAEAATERRMAAIERWRSQILEGINGAQPLQTIVKEITEMVSFMLDGARCWCDVQGAGMVGKAAEEHPDADVRHQAVMGAEGKLIGVLFVAAQTVGNSFSDADEILAIGARLIGLAIETRRLNDDLIHRTNFDLLTDTRNRFSLEQQLDEWIERARRDKRMLGLIYIDLDDFKQVNDGYGHRIGDLYLQEATKRMARQLRGNDVLARLGGDEFGVLVPEVESRAAVDEIAQRIGGCFDNPFAIDGFIIQGGASVGVALYPKDGATRENLLNSADALMYRAKHNKREPKDLVA